MKMGMLIVQFLVLMFVVVGVISFILYRTMISSTDGAVRRLTNETEEMRNKQRELTQKIKEADEELAKRKKEAEDLAHKMIEEAEEKAKHEKEVLVKKAREEGEEIIAKAQRTKDKIRDVIELEMKLKTVEFSIAILGKALSKKSQGALNQQLINEFLENLEKIEMNKIDPAIDTADVVTAAAADEAFLKRMGDIIKSKLKREIKFKVTVDEKIVGGVILRFGSLALDGSFVSMITEVGAELKKRVEDGLA